MRREDTPHIPTHEKECGNGEFSINESTPGNLELFRAFICHLNAESDAGFRNAYVFMVSVRTTETKLLPPRHRPGWSST